MKSADELLAPFTLKIWVRADAETLRRAWTRPDEVVRWFVAKCAYFAPDGSEVEEAVAGGTYRWEWIESTKEESKVIAVDATTLRFGWYKDKGELEVRFKQAGDETLMELTQTMNGGTDAERLDAQVDCKLGWTFFLSNLKSVYEGGLDLRETDPERVPVLNY